jgi:hypothetical protein
MKACSDHLLIDPVRTPSAIAIDFGGAFYYDYYHNDCINNIIMITVKPGRPTMVRDNEGF